MTTTTTEPIEIYNEAEKNYFTLSTNSHTLKERGLQFKESEISVAVLYSDIEKGVENPVFYAERYGMLYNPHLDFKPNIKANQKIKGQLVDDYWEQLPAARQFYKKVLASFTGGTNSNTGEIDAIKTELENAKNIIVQQKSDIEKLKETTTMPANNTQINQLETMIKILSETMPKIITVRVGDKENKVNAKIVHPEFETIVKYTGKKHAVYLHGNAGTGKSHIVKTAAEALGIPFWPTQALLEEHKLSGYEDAKGVYHPTAFYHAYKDGGLYMIDEIDASDSSILIGINTALANGYYDFPNGRLKAHENFRCVVAGNTVGQGADAQFVGRNPIDLATLDRFFLVEIDYYEPIELLIAKGNAELVDFAHKIREASKETGINLLFSYRSIERIADFEGDIPLPKLLQQGLIKGMAKDDLTMLIDELKMDNNSKYLKALKKAIA